MGLNLDSTIIEDGATGLKHEFFTPTPLQTLFVLTLGVPVDPTDVTFKVNGVAYAPGLAAGNYFSVSGVNVTWTNAVFTLDSSDEVEIIYTTRLP